MKAPTARRWRPSAFLWASFAGHLLALLLLAWRPALWPWLLAAVLADHGLMAVAGLCPRSGLLGANLVRLPPAACRRGEVAITIDDGPDPEVTPALLQVLARHGASATFFCIGERAQRHPQLVARMAAAGHDVENHGQHHSVLTPFALAAGWRRELSEAQQTLGALTGRRPRFYRAMAGLRNPLLDPVLARLDLRLVSWTRRGYDTRTRDPQRVLARLTRGLCAGDILLLHDGHAARTGDGMPVAVAVLPALLEELQRRGLHPVRLGQACGEQA